MMLLYSGMNIFSGGKLVEECSIDISCQRYETPSRVFGLQRRISALLCKSVLVCANKGFYYSIQI
jgi:hypothetical protein